MSEVGCAGAAADASMRDGWMFRLSTSAWKINAIIRGGHSYLCFFLLLVTELINCITFILLIKSIYIGTERFSMQIVACYMNNVATYKLKTSLNLTNFHID